MKTQNTILTLLLLAMGVCAQAPADNNIVECMVDKGKSTPELIRLTCLERGKNGVKESPLSIAIKDWPDEWTYNVTDKHLAPRQREFYRLEKRKDGARVPISSPATACDYEMHQGAQVTLPANGCRGVYQNEWNDRSKRQ